MGLQDFSQFSLEGSDGAQLAAYRSLPSQPAKGIVQIAHGMSEHFRRYGHLTQRLNAAGYAVYANDHRGHGQSVEPYGLGEFGPGGFQALVDDMAALTKTAKAEQPGLPLALVAHSMGSFAAQLYILDHSEELAALALSGTAALDKLLESLMSGGGPVTLELLNAGFEPGRTKFDWLSTDDAEVDRYMQDPLCGFTLGDSAMASVFGTGATARHDPRMARIRHDLPIYLISGEFDPVVGPSQTYSRALIDSYRQAGLTDLKHRIYPGGRHEMFNETCRGLVEDELVAWLDAKMTS